jgi:hypothetical protein
MNAVELYKKLPKKNCGKCRQRACMPFAISIIKGEAVLSDCPELSEDEIRALGSSVTTKDWREELIASLREKMRGIDLASVPPDLGGIFRDDRLHIRCLGRDFEVSRDGEINSAGHMTPWVKILLLHYIITRGKGDLAGRWVSFRELKSGMVKASSFLRECEDPLRELIDKNSEIIGRAMEVAGAVEGSGFPADRSWISYLLPKLPVAILYWQEEDEFQSKVNILFDSTADRFLDVESLMFLLEGFVKNIEMIISGGAAGRTAVKE